MTVRNDVSPDLLRKIFSYDGDTGILKWKINTGKKRLIGHVAGADKGGYVRVGLFKSDLYVHRIAWAMHYGVWPDGEIDHINLNRSDNRLLNLRISTRSQNAANAPGRSGRSKGVTPIRGAAIWNAAITVNYQRIHLGNFKTERLAAKAYSEAARKYFGEFARCE